MNSGTLRLEDNLRLADEVVLVGPGTVILEDNQLTIGGKNTTWSTNLYWNEATDMVLNSKVTLNEQWTFDGESHIAGNGNMIDFGASGFIFVRSGTTLYLNDIKLKEQQDLVEVLTTEEIINKVSSLKDEKKQEK